MSGRIETFNEFRTAEEALQDVNGLIARYRKTHDIDELTIEARGDGVKVWLSLRTKEQKAA